MSLKGIRVPRYTGKKANTPNSLKIIRDQGVITMAITESILLPSQTPSILVVLVLCYQQI